MSKFVAATGRLPENVNLFRFLPDGDYFATIRVQLPEDDPYAFWDETDVFRAFFKKGIDNVVAPDPIVDKVLEDVEFEGEHYCLTPDIVRDIVSIQGEEAFDWADGYGGWDTYSAVQDNEECAKFYQKLEPLVLDLEEVELKGAKRGGGIKTRAAQLRDGEDINDEDLYVDDESYDQEYPYIVPANEYPFIIHVHVGEPPLVS